MSTENSPPSTDSDLQFGLAVRARRAQLAITLDQLAQASGVTSGALSRVERGLLSVSLRNAMAIARGLGCELSDLVQSPAPAQITRAGAHARFVHEDTGIVRLALARPLPGLELLHYTVPPGQASSHFAPHRPGTREVFYVESGSLRVFTGADSVLLQAGDSAQLAMDTEHHFANEGGGVAHFILLVAAPTHRG